ncbi:MAG: tyrosine-type recombinase/integrase [Desulfosporosinus sp.]
MPSGYSEDEIENIISCIERKTPEGKKDYVFILLGVDHGLRVSDIINLKMSDIKWNVGTIELVQHNRRTYNKYIE